MQQHQDAIVPTANNLAMSAVQPGELSASDSRIVERPQQLTREFQNGRLIFRVPEIQASPFCVNCNTVCYNCVTYCVFNCQQPCTVCAPPPPCVLTA